MKKLLIFTLFLCAGLSLSAQKLYVLPVDGEQQGFSLDSKPKVTFGAGSMSVSTAEETKNFQISQIRNLSFTPQSSAIAMNVDDVSLIQIFPNPVKDELEVNVQISASNLYYQIFDLNGKRMKTDKLHSNSNKIDMQNFHAGTYVLHVYRDERQIQSFKIVKM